MILAIDIGNTTISYSGLIPQEGAFAPAFTAKLDTHPVLTGQEYLARVQKKLNELAPAAKFDGAILVSVVPDAEEPMAYCARRITGRAPLRVTWQNCGLSMAVDNPAAVGRDRLVDAFWASVNLPLPAVTVDMGTATTFNVIGRGGVFLGGIIAPGLATGLEALSAKTAQLPPIDLVSPGHAIGRNTLECMQIGAVTGAAAMIEGIAERVEAELGEPVSLAVTGGLAHWTSPLIRREHTYVPELLQQGLGQLYARLSGQN